jgi:pimeloyl-ACP methyl ester carboxylesterase
VLFLIECSMNFGIMARMAAADCLQAKGYEVVAVDLPPYGFSDKSHRTNQSVTAQADRLFYLIQSEFPGRQWHLAGHSMGGAVVQAFALLYPEKVIGVTFVAPALFSRIQVVDESAQNLLWSSPVGFILGALAERWFISGLRVAGLLESAYGTAPTKQQVRGYLEPLRVPGTARAILSSAGYSAELYDLDAALFDVPAIAIWGDSDSWVSHTSRSDALDRMPGVELVLMEDVGHNPMESHLDEFMEIWMEFLKRN